jgi:hypothetical protein
MKKLKLTIIVISSLLGLIINNNSFADVEQDSVQLILSVPKIISLEVKIKQVLMVPTSEDYSRKLADKYELRGCLSGDLINNNFEDKGFLDRAEAISLTIYTNAAGGAKLFVHGIQPVENILRLEDTFLSVMTEKTYILANELEGASAKGPSPPGQEIDYCTDKITGKAVFLQMSNEAQQIFSVGESTKDPRLVVFKVGIGNLDRYTEGEYTNTLVFTLMPSI